MLIVIASSKENRKSASIARNKNIIPGSKRTERHSYEQMAHLENTFTTKTNVIDI